VRKEVVKVAQLNNSTGLKVPHESKKFKKSSFAHIRKMHVTDCDCALVPDPRGPHFFCLGFRVPDNFMNVAVTFTDVMTRF
jgi:hypothetical protein